MEKKKYTTEELRVMSPQEFSLLLHGLPRHKKELAKGFNQLPDSVKPAVIRLIELLNDDAVTQIKINGPESMYVTRSGEVNKEEGFNLTDSASYYSFFNQFFLPLTEIDERTGEDFIFEGFLSIPDFHNADSAFPARVARVHAIDYPIVDCLTITIATKPRL